jgi:hypothetical protein
LPRASPPFAGDDLDAADAVARFDRHDQYVQEGPADAEPRARVSTRGRASRSTGSGYAGRRLRRRALGTLDRSTEDAVMVAKPTVRAPRIARSVPARRRSSWFWPA